jgi:hypothetical protein
MMRGRQSGSTLVVGLVLLSLVTLLGLAGAESAHVERLLAQNERFRENAASAANAGLEIAVSRIVAAADPAAVAASNTGIVPGTTDRYETSTRFLGFETAMPQDGGGPLAGAHFEILSTGNSARGAIDRQRARVMLVLDHAGATPLPCAPVVSVRCRSAGEFVRISWQRVTP